MILNFLDIICFSTIGLSVLAGIYTGAVRLIIGFVFFVLSIVLAYLFEATLEDIALKHVSNPLAVLLISSCCSYIISAVFCAFIAGRIKKLTSDISGGFADRLMGASLGAVRGGILSILIFLSALIVSSASYSNSKDVLELITPKERDKYPNWVKGAFSFKEQSMAINKAIELIGPQTFEEIQMPKAKIIQEDHKNGHKDAFDSIK